MSVLRDTGCTTAVIRRGFVTDEQRTGKFKCYRVLDGSMGKAETAVLDVESPIYTGKLECLCINSPVCDLIIGNVHGVVLIVTVTWFRLVLGTQFYMAVCHLP